RIVVEYTNETTLHQSATAKLSDQRPATPLGEVIDQKADTELARPLREPLLRTLQHCPIQAFHFPHPEEIDCVVTIAVAVSPIDVTHGGHYLPGSSWRLSVVDNDHRQAKLTEHPPDEKFFSPECNRLHRTKHRADGIGLEGQLPVLLLGRTYPALEPCNRRL